jgi:hypothetical protein
VQGTSPKEMAPNLFKQVRFKRRSISYEMQNLNWVRNIQNINTTVLLQEFVMLYVALQQVGLNENRDEIVWRWSANRKLSVSSVMSVSFMGPCLCSRPQRFGKLNLNLDLGFLLG